VIYLLSPTLVKIETVTRVTIQIGFSVTQALLLEDNKILDASKIAQLGQIRRLSAQHTTITNRETESL